MTELTTDTHSILSEAKTDYADFLNANATLNTKLAAVYAHAKLAPPTLSQTDVLAGTTIAGNVDRSSANLKIADIVVDMAGAGAMVELAPAATLYLVDAGALTADAAATTLASAFGTELTVGSLFGGVVGVVVVGVVGGAITFAASQFVGQQQTTELRGGIAKMATFREKAALARDRSRVLCDVVKATSTTCDQLMGRDLLNEIAIDSLIRQQAQPALKALAKVNRLSAVTELYQLDMNRDSWLQDG